MGVLGILLALQDWSPLGGFEAASHDFFSTSIVERLGLRLSVFDDLTFEVYPKLPFAQGRARWRGETVDVAFASAARIHDVQLRLGMSLPFVPDAILAREEDVETTSFAFAGAAYTWRVAEEVELGLQLELNTTSFHARDLLQRHPASAALGLRACGWEAGFGVGADRMEGWDWMAYLGLALRF